MAEAALYQYLQPLTFALFALGFTFIWYYIRSISAAGYFAAAYLAGSMAFLLEIHRDNLSSLTINLTLACYFATSCLLTTGMFVRARTAVPWKVIVILLVVFLFLFVTGSYVAPGIETRTLLANFFNAAIIGLPLIVLKHRKHILIDKILFWLLAVIVAQFILRTIGTLYLEWGSLSVSNFATSITGIAFRFTTALAAVAMAVTLYVALGIDIVYALKKQSDTDNMTGLRNRGGFEEKARKLMSVASMNRKPLCLIVTDLDRFKQVNDTLGHTVGDIVIGFYGRILGNMTRKSDLAGRVGGEEFCVMLTDCALDDAADLAEAVRQSFCETIVPGVKPDLRCSASFGIAMMRGDENFSELYKRADEALYQAKNAGRNCVRVIDNYNWRPVLNAPPMQPDLMRRAGDVTAKAG